MQFDRATLCLPIADRRASHTFYTALGFEPVGELGEDGLPEPLQIQVSDGLRMMLIPTGGFGWVIGDRDVARSTAHECILAVGLPTETEVDDLMRRAQDAGANVVYPPGNQAWGSGDDTSDDSDDESRRDRRIRWRLRRPRRAPVAGQPRRRDPGAVAQSSRTTGRRRAPPRRMRKAGMTS